jgi:hypothetical protein
MARITQQSSIHTTGTSYENEPVIKSDAASSDVMEWAASTGTSSIKIRENSANDLVLDVEGGLELADRIASVTSSVTIGAVFIYDTKNTDSDGGAWRKKCKGLSWFDEAASATRSARSEFPAMSLIVSDTAGGSGNNGSVTIYDLDDPALPVWMVFDTTNPGWLYWWNVTGSQNVSSLFALNGRLWLGIDNTSGALAEINFVGDYAKRWSNSDVQLLGPIADRNSSNTSTAISGATAIVNRIVNDVAATVLEGAEIGALGLPIPTVAVATDGGVSVIHPSGDVYNDTYQIVSSKEAGTVGFNSTGGFYYGSRVGSSAGQYHYFINRRNMIYADTSVITGSDLYRTAASGFGTPNLSLLGGSSTAMITSEASTKDSFAIGQTGGLSLVKYNTGNPEEGAVCDITSSYNTGYMVGDIRGAWLTDDAASGRSVNDINLSTTGTIDDDPVDGAGGGAELKAYSGFTASDYLWKSYKAEFDFGTTDFSVMFWAKWTATDPAASQIFVDRGSTARFLIYDPSSNGKPQLYVTDGSSASNITTTNDYDDGNWHQVVALRRSSKLYIYVDGVDAQTTSVASTQDLDDSSGVLRVGVNLSAADPLNGSLSLLRISATAPTPQQIKEIYEAEKPLFAANAKCLLQSGNNAVSGLAYDKSTSLLTVAQTIGSGAVPGATIFRGLEQVATFDGKAHDSAWSGYTISEVSTAGGVSAYSRQTGSAGGTIIDLPSVDVRAALQEGEDKIPDDGKFHFSGVTTDATPTIIGQIPIGEGEWFNLTARFTSANYAVPSSAKHLGGEIKQRFYRDYGGNVSADTEQMKLVEEGLASLDIDLDVVTASQTVKLVATGWATTRMNWSAEVEVQRISEKQYER